LKTLYRLASDKPLKNINAPVVRAIWQTLEVDLSKLFALNPPEPKLERIDPRTQKRLDYLMARSNEGELTSGERGELEALASKLEALSIKNAQVLAQRRRSSVQKPVPKRNAKTNKSVAAWRNANW